MQLSYTIYVDVTEEEANVINHMEYAGMKLWNIANYEKMNYKELGIPYPDKYDQDKRLKDTWCYRSLPSQTGQRVIHQNDAGWESFYTAKKNGAVENPHPPRYKHELMAIHYAQNGIKHEKGSTKVRLTLSSGLKEHMFEKYGISMNYLYLENETFRVTDNIKQISLYPPEKGKMRVVVVYEIGDPELLEDNGRYMSIDLGVHNFLTCYISESGESFIAGRKYLSTERWYQKTIAHKQERWYSQQKAMGIKYPKMSYAVKDLYEDRRNKQSDYLHKMTAEIVDICVMNNIHTVVVGDITGIRKKFKGSDRTNQQMHSLPYKKVIGMLEYKLRLQGIRLVRQNEAWTSQCSPFSKDVSKRYAKKENRVKRGLFVDGQYSWNADVVGAFNILRKFLKKEKSENTLNPFEIKTPYILKVAA